MRPEIEGIWAAISNNTLPTTAEDLFGPGWSFDEQRFILQETYVADFKLTLPSKFSDEYGVGIVRLALAMYNSYGGIIIFGVHDNDQTVVGVKHPFPIEAFNRILSDVTGRPIECFTRNYNISGTGETQVAVVLVPRRGAVRPAALIVDLGRYQKGSLWIRDRHEAKIANAKNLAQLFSNRVSLPAEAQYAAEKPIQRSLPPPPATIHQFIGRETILADLWEWFTFGNQPRLYLHGPGGGQARAHLRTNSQERSPTLAST